MLYVIILFFLVSLYLYFLLGGADFGAGIIEITSRGKFQKKTRQLVSNAMAPIWEANHMWLIIAVVILFNAFPAAYSQIMISLSIPIIILLIGIVLRGSAFTFRHYDAIKDNSQEVYSKVFEYSSLVVAFFFGLVVGGLVSGKILLHPNGFYETYIAPWFNLFSISIGLFITSLFAFIADVFLISESTDADTLQEFVRKSKRANIAAVLSGGLVFLSSVIEGVDFTWQFFSIPASIIMIILASLSLPILWKVLGKGLKWPSRILAGAQTLFIISAFYAVFFPTLVRIKDSYDLTFYNTAAPKATLDYLGWALIIGSLIIFPTLFYLMKVFKLSKENDDEGDGYFINS